MNKIFVDASKTMKSTKMLVLENFRLYSITSLWHKIMIDHVKYIIVTVLAKTCHVRTKTEFNFIAAVQTHSISIHPHCIKCQMLTGLLFSRAFCRPSRVTAETMGPMEGANWTVRTCICSHWLCGLLECYWPLCGCYGCSWSVPRVGPGLLCSKFCLLCF